MYTRRLQYSRFTLQLYRSAHQSHVADNVNRKHQTSQLDMRFGQQLSTRDFEKDCRILFNYRCDKCYHPNFSDEQYRLDLFYVASLF